MPAYARRPIVDESIVGVYHCVARCVRRAFLCGVDRYTAVDVLGFSAMSNHLHLLVRIRPDLAAAWSDEEVASRWWRLHPGRRKDDGTPAEPEPQELAMLLADADALAKRRRRLPSLSWFMAALL
ncbi:MAG TPA: hypothetical protein VFW87_22510 [Pirellulales bacterium]|nr:hypothetical protein [Pirellulales bacterium]